MANITNGTELGDDIMLDDDSLGDLSLDDNALFDDLDSEIKLDQASAEITLCPTFYWEERGVEFVVFKVAADRYRSQFYYSIAEQYGTGRDFHDLAECLTTTLRLQADHEKDRAGATSGKTGADLSKT